MSRIKQLNTIITDAPLSIACAVRRSNVLECVSTMTRMYFAAAVFARGGIITFTSDDACADAL